MSAKGLLGIANDYLGQEYTKPWLLFLIIIIIAFVNSERWLAKSRVDITLCQHGKFPATFLLMFFVLYYKRNIKHFFVLIYSYINPRENWKNSKLCENTSPCGRRVSTQFLVFPISTRVDITVYQHGKCFIFLKYNVFSYYQTNDDKLWRFRFVYTRCKKKFCAFVPYNFQRFCKLKVMSSSPLWGLFLATRRPKWMFWNRKFFFVIIVFST